MPANVRIRCRFIDCKFLDGLFCGNTDIEVDPKQSCISYVPVETPSEVDDDDPELEEEEELSIEQWEEEEDEEEIDDLGTNEFDE